MAALQHPLRVAGSVAIAISLSLIGICPTPVPAQSDPTLLHRVDVHYNHLHTLRARYSEHYTGMGQDRTETGTLLLRKPGLMRWSYDAPPGKVFVLDGRFAWFYTPGDAQVSRTPAKQLDDLRSPLRLLLGHTQLAKELDHITTTQLSCDDSVPVQPNYACRWRITGVPKGMAAHVRLLTLTVTQTGVIQSMKLEETTGATTEFTFTNIAEDIPTTPADFTFTPPRNLPILDNPSPI